MYIPGSLLWALEDHSCIGVKLYCEEELREVITSRFTKVFNKEYEKLMDLIEKKEGACYEKEEGLNPFNGAQVADYGIFLSFNTLAMYRDINGDHISSYSAGDTLEKALKIIKQEYPLIRYEGYVAYYWTDVHSGEVCQYGISSEKKKRREVIYDFVGEALAKAFMDDETWEGLSEELEWSDENEFKEIIKCLHMYSKWVPSEIIDRVIGFSENNDEVITESLQEYLDALRSGEDVKIEE